MKKSIGFIFAAACLLFLSGNTASAQVEWQEYTWEPYKVSFSVPSTHEEKKSGDDQFESGDETTWIELYPYKDASETPKSMIEGVVGEKGMKILNKGGAYKTGGYDGYWITCEDAAHPDWQYWYIGFIDPASDVNFYAIIWFKKGNEAARKIASDMSYKFKKME